MDMRRLEVFCKVLEHKSFTKAAEALHLAQPTVSEHVKSLEDSLGDKLVDRLGREVLPTSSGRVFYQYARNILRLREEAVQALEQFRGHLSGHLILGASTIPGTYVLPKLIGQFKKEHPAVSITLRIAGSSEIVSEILQNNVEAGMVGSRWNDRRLLSEELFSDELVLVVPPQHRWAGKTRIRKEDLDGEPFVLREKGSGTRITMNRILEIYGFELSNLNAVAEMGTTEAVREGVKAGIGVSILSKQAVAEDIQRGALHVVELENVRFQRPLYLVQRKNRHLSPICSAFLEHLRASVAEITNSPDALL